MSSGDSEGAWLAEQTAGDAFVEELDQRERENHLDTMYRRYNAAKNADTGATINCPCCNRAIVKTTYNKVFCSNSKTKGKRGKRNSCKDKFWNEINPRGIYAHLADG